jgi:hypothetical protein
MSPVLTAGGAHLRLLASGDSDLGAGFIAFVVVLVMCIACYFLFRSMSGHLKKVPASFDTPSAPTAPPAPDDEQ